MLNNLSSCLIPGITKSYFIVKKEVCRYITSNDLHAVSDLKPAVFPELSESASVNVTAFGGVPATEY